MKTKGIKAIADGPWLYRLLWMSAFAVSMGFMESAVVVYLRALFYPGGFDFPLQSMPASLLVTEVLREAATLIMLLGVAFIWAKNGMERLGAFLWNFALWDISYYLFLFLILGWPPALQTWDILFLIPLPWVGPVWAPCLLSLLMAALALFIFSQKHPKPLPFNPWEWAGLLSGSAISVGAFLWPALSHPGFKEDFFNPDTPKRALEALQDFIPAAFPHVLFGTGVLCLLLSLGSYGHKTWKRRRLLGGQFF